jgi:TRAP-type mannitol/chloroaromatic compound transport system permease large subunit
MIFMALLFIAVLLAGVPVFIALAGSSFIYTHFIAELPDFVILHRMAGGIDSFPLLAVPFFILAGNLMNSAGITNRIYDFAVALAGWTRGGLAHVNIIGSVIFAGMSGTAIADAAGLGTIEIKAMQITVTTPNSRSVSPRRLPRSVRSSHHLCRSSSTA